MALTWDKVGKTGKVGVPAGGCSTSWNETSVSDETDLEGAHKVKAVLSPGVVVGAVFVRRQFLAWSGLVVRSTRCG